MCVCARTRVTGACPRRKCPILKHRDGRGCLLRGQPCGVGGAARDHDQVGGGRDVEEWTEGLLLDGGGLKDLICPGLWEFSSSSVEPTEASRGCG